MPSKRFLDVEKMYSSWMDACEFALTNNQGGYLNGGEDPVNGVDCSGLVIFVLNRCGLNRDEGQGISSRLRSLDLMREYFTRPQNFTDGYTNIVLGKSSGPSGPDPAFGPYGSMFRAYFSGGVLLSDTWHIVLGYGRELGIEATSATVRQGRRVGDTYTLEADGLVPDIAFSTTFDRDSDGVRVRSVVDYPTNPYTLACYLSFDAIKDKLSILYSSGTYHRGNPIV